MDNDSKLITEAWYRTLSKKGIKDWEDTIQVMQKQHHRNGVSGAPFDVYLFTQNGKEFIGVDFGEERFAVLGISDLTKGDIGGHGNTHRGDQYANVIHAKWHTRWEDDDQQTPTERTTLGNG